MWTTRKQHHKTVGIAQGVMIIEGQVTKAAIQIVRECATYRHVASAAAAAAVAVHIIVLGVGLGETKHAGLALPQTRLAARHPASLRLSLVPPG